MNKQWTRSRRDRMVSGVCGGLAELICLFTLEEEGNPGRQRTQQNKNFVALQADMWYHSSCQDFDPTFQEVPPCSDIPTARRFYGIS